MTMTTLDRTIVIGCVAVLTWFSLRSVKYMQSAADFLSANRSAGRYILTMAGSATGLGAISAVGMFDQYYVAGMPTIWWSGMVIPVGIIIALSGWVVYRVRETRCMTLAQFFEVCYSRRFRIFAGIVVWLSGVLDFGIFPYVASNFFVYYCGLPETIAFGTFEISTYWPIMLLTTGLALIYTTIGGHIPVMVTDYIALSLTRWGESFNLDRMLHRGAYDVKGDHKVARDATRSVWLKLVGITDEVHPYRPFPSSCLGALEWPVGGDLAGLGLHSGRRRHPRNNLVHHRWHLRHTARLQKADNPSM